MCFWCRIDLTDPQLEDTLTGMRVFFNSISTICISYVFQTASFSSWETPMILHFVPQVPCCLKCSSMSELPGQLHCTVRAEPPQQLVCEDQVWVQRRQIDILGLLTCTSSCVASGPPFRRLQSQGN